MRRAEAKFQIYHACKILSLTTRVTAGDKTWAFAFDKNAHRQYRVAVSTGITYTTPLT